MLSPRLRTSTTLEAQGCWHGQALGKSWTSNHEQSIGFQAHELWYSLHLELLFGKSKHYIHFSYIIVFHKHINVPALVNKHSYPLTTCSIKCSWGESREVHQHLLLRPQLQFDSLQPYYFHPSFLWGAQRCKPFRPSFYRQKCWGWAHKRLPGQKEDQKPGNHPRHSCHTIASATAPPSAICWCSWCSLRFSSFQGSHLGWTLNVETQHWMASPNTCPECIAKEELHFPRLQIKTLIRPSPASFSTLSEGFSQ